MKTEKLPPGQIEVKKAPLRHKGEIPKIDLKTWKLKVNGKVKIPLSLALQELSTLPAVASVSNFHCVEGWSVLENKWEGISFKTIVDMAKPEESAKHVFIECADGYTTSLPLEDLMENEVLLAYKLNDKMLPPERGGPLRLVVPKKYAYKSAMWVEKIRFTDKHELGYWEKRGYSDTADPWKEDRYAK